MDEHEFKARTKKLAFDITNSFNLYRTAKPPMSLDDNCCFDHEHEE